jgi:DNA-binding PadR family transcriptional regulator
MRHVVQENGSVEWKPLSEPVLLILTSLAAQPRHGYALLQDIQQISNNRVMLSTGTLYGALRRLLDGGLIERFETDDSSRDKQAYKLTADGRQQLRLEVERMKQLTRAAMARLKESEV